MKDSRLLSELVSFAINKCKTFRKREKKAIVKFINSIAENKEIEEVISLKDF